MNLTVLVLYVLRLPIEELCLQKLWYAFLSNSLWHHRYMFGKACMLILRAQLDASLVAHHMATSSNECGRHNLLRTTCVPSLYGVVLSEFWQKVRQVQIADA